MAKFHKGLQIVYFKDITQEKDSHNFLPSNGPPPTATHCLALSFILYTALTTMLLFSEDDPPGARVVFARPWGGAVLKLSV